MGCGVSKEEIVEPSRIQSVPVSLGSPESHLKAHEALQHQHQHQHQNYGLISLADVDLKDNEHFDAAKGLKRTSSCCPPLSPVEATAADGGDDLKLVASAVTVSTTAESTQSGFTKPEVSPAQERSAGERQCCQRVSTSSLVCLSYASTRGPLDEVALQQCEREGSPLQPEGHHGSPLAKALTTITTTSSDEDFMRGSLDCLKEILDDSEADSLRLAIKTTAKKIMSYGGVLHSLEDHVGTFSSTVPYSASNEKDDGTELMTTGADSEDKSASAKQNLGKLRSPRSPRPELDYSRKKLPPIVASCNSNVGEKSASPDPFSKAPLSQLHQSRTAIPSSPPEDNNQATEATTTTKTSTAEPSRDVTNRFSTASSSSPSASSSSSSSSSPSPSPSPSPHSVSSSSSCSSPDLEQSIQNIKDIVVLDSHPPSTYCYNNNHQHSDEHVNGNGHSNSAAIDDSDKLSDSPLVPARWTEFESLKVNSDEPDVESINMDDHEHRDEEKAELTRKPQDVLSLSESISFDDRNGDNNSKAGHQSSCCHGDHAGAGHAHGSEVELHHITELKYDLKALGRGDIQSPLLASLGASPLRNSYQADGVQPLSSSEFYS